MKIETKIQEITTKQIILNPKTNNVKFYDFNVQYFHIIYTYFILFIYLSVNFKSKN